MAVMKWCIAFACALMPSAASACPPRNEELAAQAAELAGARVQRYKRDVMQADTILYDVMESRVGYAARKWRKTGLLRILHVYKGPYARGQRIRIKGGYSPFAECSLLPPLSFKAGSYGVIAFNAPTGPEAVMHTGWLTRELFDDLVAQGIIRNARQSGMADRRAGASAGSGNTTDRGIRRRWSDLRFDGSIERFEPQTREAKNAVRAPG
ncbi:hypothetical protein [Sphingomonas colocasiae]|uniref:Uncharacterized protein n=1 Tax=Sphingomonas colocasiae TaxID=1848973 RepID=A0ABS7PKQ8_9SPHN|nr:hypothetical protein [Sphingomonas colocasiae]MBY8821888.1 hypothetical protein [Sphingomonas colocasiae]